MFVFNMLFAIVGIALLIGFLLFFTVVLVQGKKSSYSYFTFAIVLFFLGVAVWQSLKFFKILF